MKWFGLAPNIAAATLATITFFLLTVVAIIDAVFASKRLGPVGQHVVKFLRRYPVYYFVLTVLYGALIGHFFLKWD
jgi:hypothetical protein